MSAKTQPNQDTVAELQRQAAEDYQAHHTQERQAEARQALADARSSGNFNAAMRYGS